MVQTAVIGLRTQKKLSYLAHHRPDLLEQVEQGRLSPDRAYRLAKGIPDETVVDRVQRAWNNASPEEKPDLAAWILAAFVDAFAEKDG